MAMRFRVLAGFRRKGRPCVSIRNLGWREFGMEFAGLSCIIPCEDLLTWIWPLRLWREQHAWDDGNLEAPGRLPCILLVTTLLGPHHAAGYIGAGPKSFRFLSEMRGFCLNQLQLNSTDELWLHEILQPFSPKEGSRVGRANTTYGTQGKFKQVMWEFQTTPGSPVPELM